MSNQARAAAITLGIIVFFAFFVFLVIITKGIAIIGFIVLTMLYAIYSSILEDLNRTDQIAKRFKPGKGEED